MNDTKQQKTAPSVEDAVAAALNEQGFLFAQIVREKICNRLQSDKDTQNGWQFVASEYPVTAEDGNQTRIDHVLRQQDTYISLECKRSNPNYKRWVFFDEIPDSQARVAIETVYFDMRSFEKNIGNHGMRTYPMPPPCRVFNYYSEAAQDRQEKWSATDTIEKAFQQVMRGQSGLMSKLLSYSEGCIFRTIPVVVTTADLLALNSDANKISLQLGQIDPAHAKPTALHFCAVNYHADDKLAVKSDYAKGVRNSVESDLLVWQVRTVFVVQATSINEFLRWATTNLLKLM